MSWDSVWDDVYRTRAWGQYPGEDVIRFVKREFGAAPDRGRVRLLEVGCGAGANLWFMAREGFGVRGVEGSPTAVRLAEERLDRECPGWRAAGGRIDAGDMARVDAPAGSFDAVLDVVAVCYAGFDDAARIYAELARVTRPGGRLFSRTFARGCWGEGTGAPAGPGMWQCAEGPLAGLGATRFTGEDEVPALLGPDWRVDRIERATQTEDDRRHEIRYLQIHATREGAWPA
ncbi:MAG: class I SAM-dependent methyltransferase [Ramlibacter sp.]